MVTARLGLAISLAGGVLVQLAPLAVPLLLARWAQTASPHVFTRALVGLVSAMVIVLLLPVLTRVQRHRLLAAGSRCRHSHGGPAG